MTQPFKHLLSQTYPLPQNTTLKKIHEVISVSQLKDIVKRAVLIPHVDGYTPVSHIGNTVVHYKLQANATGYTRINHLLNNSDTVNDTDTRLLELIKQPALVVKNNQIMSLFVDQNGNMSIEKGDQS